MRSRNPAATIGVMIVTALLLLVAGVGLRARPWGYFDSTPIMGYHDDSDVLSFLNGKVTWATCCGSTRLGSYSESEGVWIWRVDGQEWQLVPGVGRLVCRELANPTNEFVLRRRLLPPHKDGH